MEPTRKAAQIVHKKLLACLQSQQGLDAEKRMVRRTQRSANAYNNVSLITMSVMSPKHSHV